MLERRDAVKIYIPRMFVDLESAREIWEIVRDLEDGVDTQLLALLERLVQSIGATTPFNHRRCLPAVVDDVYFVYCESRTNIGGTEETYSTIKIVMPVLARDDIIVLAAGNALRELEREGRLRVYVFFRDDDGERRFEIHTRTAPHLTLAARLCVERGDCSLTEFLHLAVLVEPQKESGAVLARNYEAVKSAGLAVELGGEALILDDVPGAEWMSKIIEIRELYSVAERFEQRYERIVKAIYGGVQDALYGRGRVKRMRNVRRDKIINSTRSAVVAVRGGGTANIADRYTVISENVMLFGAMLVSDALTIVSEERVASKESLVYRAIRKRVAYELRRNGWEQYADSLRTVRWKRAVLRAGNAEIEVAPASGGSIVGLLTHNIFVPLTPVRYTVAAGRSVIPALRVFIGSKYSEVEVKDVASGLDARFFIVEKHNIDAKILAGAYVNAVRKLYGTVPAILSSRDYVEAFVNTVPLEEAVPTAEKLAFFLREIRAEVERGERTLERYSKELSIYINNWMPK